MKASAIFAIMFIVYLLASFGIALILFMLGSLIPNDLPLGFDLQSWPSMILIGVVALIFLYLLSGLNASIIKAYHTAINGSATGFLNFYSYGLSKAAPMFILVLLRDIISMVLIAPVLALYLYALSGYQFTDIILYLYCLCCIFFVHLLATPALISVALGRSLFESFKAIPNTLKSKHVYFIGLFILFAFTWILNIVPLLINQIISIFFLCPVIYSALILMVAGDES